MVPHRLFGLCPGESRLPAPLAEGSDHGIGIRDRRVDDLRDDRIADAGLVRQRGFVRGRLEESPRFSLQGVPLVPELRRPKQACQIRGSKAASSGKPNPSYTNALRTVSQSRSLTPTARATGYQRDLTCSSMASMM